MFSPEMNRPLLGGYGWFLMAAAAESLPSLSHVIYDKGSHDWAGVGWSGVHAFVDIAGERERERDGNPM